MSSTTNSNVAYQPAVFQPRRLYGTENYPISGSDHSLIEERGIGPGVFVAALASKSGGANGQTHVHLRLDGRTIVQVSYAGAELSGLTQSNPFGVVLLQGTQPDFGNLTIGYPTPLRFERDLAIAVEVNEPDVRRISAEVVYGILPR